MIKIKIGDTKSIFPKLMIATTNGDIVLFTKPECGFSFSSNSYRETFNMECFVDYNQSLTIQNE